MESSAKNHINYMYLSDKVQRLNILLLNVNWSNYTTEFNSLNSEQNELINLIIQLIPEWQRLINCRQHITHDFSLDVHTILVMKKIKETQEYKLLTDYEKLILLYTALLHDIEKIEGEVDPEHSAKGAEKAITILYRLGFGEDFINDVYILIKNHQIFGLMAANRLDIDNQNLIKTLKRPYLAKMLAILSIADIKSVKNNEAFYSEKIGEVIKNIMDKINQEFRNVDMK